MKEPSESLVNFRAANYSLQLRVDNPELTELYASKLNRCFTQLQLFLSRSTKVKIEDSIYYGLAQGLIKRFDDLVNSLGQLVPKELGSILNDVTDNFLQAAMIGLNRIQNDWDVVCKVAFKDKTIHAQSCRLSGISLMNADPHNNGQVPWQCEITLEQNNKKSLFFYKPSPIIIDMLLHGNTSALQELNIAPLVCKKYNVTTLPRSFAEIMHVSTQAANLSSYLIVPMKDRGLIDPNKLFDHYGYMEFLIADTKKNSGPYSLDQHRRYSMQAGKVAAAALICGMPDMHYDNLLICNGMIFVIDSENSFIPSIPNPDLTQLFRKGLGGFYGDYQDKPNRFFFVRDNVVEMYDILEAEFMYGAKLLFHTIKQRYDAIREWLVHPIFLHAPLRIIPLATREFYELRRDVLEQRMHGRMPDDIRYLHLERLMLPDEIAQLQQTPRDTFSDTEMQSVIFMGDNLRLITDSLYKGDIPTFYMLVNNRALLMLNGHAAMLPGSLDPINYFLHTPGQALHDRIQLFGYSQVYRDVSLDNLQHHLLTINNFLAHNRRIEGLENKRIALQNVAIILYRLLDCTCVLSYVAMATSRDTPDTNLINNIIGLNALLSSITREMLVQGTHEVRFASAEIAVLMKRAEELLKSLHTLYIKSVVHIGQQYTLHGKIAQTYNSLLLLQDRISQQPAQEEKPGESPRAVQPPKIGLRMAENSKKKEPDIGEQPKSGPKLKP